MLSQQIKVKCTSCLSKSPSLNDLTPSEKELIKKNCNITNFVKGELVFKQDTPATHVMYVKNGLVKISNKGINNNYLIIKLEKGGSFIGLSSLFGDSVYNCSAIAVEASDICFIEKEIFIQLLMQNGQFAHSIVELISKLELFINKRLYNIIHKQVPGRMSDLFLYFANEIYNSTVFSFPLNRKELAEFIGTSIKSFIRTLNEFRDDGLINIEGKQIKIARMDLIERLSSIG